VSAVGLHGGRFAPRTRKPCLKGERGRGKAEQESHSGKNGSHVQKQKERDRSVTWPDRRPRGQGHVTAHGGGFSYEHDRTPSPFVPGNLHGAPAEP
jgi:hypothetical protein